MYLLAHTQIAVISKLLPKRIHIRHDKLTLSTRLYEFKIEYHYSG
jgi:hypothetical protein